MLKRTSVVFFVVLSLLSLGLLGVFKQHEYEEYNYTKVEEGFENVLISASMTGTYEDVQGEKESLIKRNPYYLKVVVYDLSQSSDTVEIKSTKLIGDKSGHQIILTGFQDIVKFTASRLNEGIYAAFVTNNFNLSDEDYEVNITLEICKKSGNCERKQLAGMFQLKVVNYTRNSLIDKILSV